MRSSGDDGASSRGGTGPSGRTTLAAIAAEAAQMLGELIEDRPLHSRRVELSTELIVRESTGPVR